MAVYVAMLRGINVGGKKKIKMAELAALFEGLGHTDVVTYIQSGNVVFESSVKSATALVSALESRIMRELGIDVTVVLRTKAELGKVIAGNPFARGTLAKVHVAFLAGTPRAELVRALDGHASLPDEFRIQGREVYLHTPGGYGTTKLNNAFWERRLQTKSTARNWNTVTKLFELAGG